MNYFKSVAIFQTCGLASLVESRHHFVEVVEKLNKLFWLDPISPDLEYCKRGVTVPPLVNYEVLVFLLMHHLNSVLNVQEVLGRVK